MFHCCYAAWSVCVIPICIQQWVWLGIAILCLVGGVVGGIAQAVAVRFGLRGMNQIFMVTQIVGVATGMAVMVGTGVATAAYGRISELTGWGVHTIAAFVIGTCLMCLVGGLAGSFANMFFKLIRKHVTA
jgi:hypothetical protein